MVVFSCDACGDSLRKKDVKKHYQFKCRTCESLTCVDCKKQFWGDHYASHTQCITDEDFKYGLVSQHKDDKGQVKQNQWRSNIDNLLSNRSTYKHWVPILLEMQKYENVPRKKKPFMNWCRCTMKRFPLKVVEEIFDKLFEMNSKAQQIQQQHAPPSKNCHREGSMESKSGCNDKDGTEENGSMNVDFSDIDKRHAKDKKRKRQLNGDPQISTTGNAKNGNQNKNKRQKLVDSDNEVEKMDHDADGKGKNKKRHIASEDDIPEKEEDPNKGVKEEKFRLKKCVVQILVAKEEPVKIKRILKKVLAAYNVFIEARAASGRKGKAWSEQEVSAKLEKLTATNKAFKNCNGVIQLSATGKAKYVSKDGTVVESD
ncbi:hypothetical protein BIW11_09832 [Tropilaelaps mercedesae]|uniref:Zinc finger C2H2 LYAR-type domain-containing protein n=1 Tax=Tropilaelaps mercedesae TaxID=418985 RepID=A0A1V9XIR7_9ACAR|nr:hypothetical protein BIW11_09832 [Tropilaelaps mercedesae]